MPVSELPACSSFHFRLLQSSVKAHLPRLRVVVGDGGTGEGEERLVVLALLPSHHQTLQRGAAHHVVRTAVDDGDEGPLSFGRYHGNLVANATL